VIRRGCGARRDTAASSHFQAINKNKRSVVLNLADTVDQRRAATLSRRADVVVENLLPGTMRKFGLDYPTVSARNPSVVYCSISGFGSQPGGSHVPGYDLLVQAVGGLMSISGEPDGAPMKVGVALVDVVCGLHAGLGTLAALRNRERSGRGQLVEVNLLASLFSALTNQSSA
jgi:crotonobetainyl-CoA:carnitine CoA-transferase CaiB-like acyl-CoA transferase